MHTFSQILDRIISDTAWKMIPPKAYGGFHLIFTLVGVLLSILLAHRLRHLGERGNRRLLVSVGVFLMLTEVYKQLFYYYYIGDNSYQWWIFPFQLCSVPMYLCVIAPFLPDGKIKNGMYHFMTTFNLLGGLMAFLEPSGIIHEYWTLTLHAFIWHMTLVFIGFYLIASGRCAKRISDYRSASVTFLALAVVAFSINLIFRRVSEGTINMFFVGPSNSPLIVFSWISEKIGWYVSTLLYLPVVCLGAYLIFLPVHLYEKRKAAQAPSDASAELSALKRDTPAGVK